MPIDLGLSRVTRLLALLGNPHLRWKAIHIAGTNGKGSICAYLSSILTQSHIRNGKFTSPHLIHQWDCITIDNKPIDEQTFQLTQSKIDALNRENGVNATEFEVLTCVAFEVFRLCQVEIGIVEVGLGGRLDATNVLPAANATNSNNGVIATGISKIGMDHEGILGNTLSEIAYQKAGIIKEGVPCVVDATNDPQVLSVIEKASEELVFVKGSHLHSPLKGSYQKVNMGIAVEIIAQCKKLNPEVFERVGDTEIAKGIKHVQWAGRLQHTFLKVGDSQLPVLIDGAHNAQAAEELAHYLNTQVRDGNPLVFVVAITKGKDCGFLSQHLIQKNDIVIVTKFGHVAGMPWIEPCNVEDLASLLKGNIVHKTDTVADAIELADSLSRENKLKVVICGSLYLAGNVLKLYSI